MKKAISLITMMLLVAPNFAMAETGDGRGIGAGIGAGLAIGLAALGGGFGQGKLVSAGLESIGRNPAASGKLFTPLILGLVFVEALVILSFVIAIQLKGVLG
jgi:F-type H+-transporting ATPase subunit c